jgi:signal transduction histidine kinase
VAALVAAGLGMAIVELLLRPERPLGLGGRVSYVLLGVLLVAAVGVARARLELERASFEGLSDAMLAFADAAGPFSATHTSTDDLALALDAGLTVMLGRGAFLAVDLGGDDEVGDDHVALLLDEARTQASIVVAPFGLQRGAPTMLVGVPIASSSVPEPIGAIVLRVPSGVPDEQLALVEGFLRRVAPALGRAVSGADLRAAGTPEVDVVPVVPQVNAVAVDRPAPPTAPPTAPPPVTADAAPAISKPAPVVTAPAAGPTHDPASAIDSSLVARATSDLRAPLSSLAVTVDMLTRRGDQLTQEHRDELHGVLARSTRRVSSWVISLLEDSLRGTESTPSGHPVAAVELIEAAIETADAALVGIEVTQQPTELVAMADVGLAVRALTRVLAEVGRHSAIGDRVDVGADDAGMWVELTVRGRGASFAAAAAFVESGHSDDRGASSLSPTAQLVDRWGGAVGVRGDRNGDTTIWLTVPMATDTESIGVAVQLDLTDRSLARGLGSDGPRARRGLRP